MKAGFDWRGRAESSIDALMQALIASDETALAGLVELEGRCIGIELSGLNLQFYLSVAEGRLRFSTLSRSPPDVSVKASVDGVVAYFLAVRRGEAPPPGVVSLSGDLAVAQRLQAWIAKLNIDLEELLARYWGDVVATGVFRMGRRVSAEAASSTATLLRASADFLQHESGVLVSRLEVATFMDEVDQLRERFDRLSARVDRLLALATGPASR